MFPKLPLGFIAFALLVFVLPAAAGTTTILDCNFDAETLDALAGTGGAEAGQLYSLGGAPALVRSAPFGTSSLEIGDDSSITAEAVRFQFLNNWEIDRGVLTISLNLWFHEFEDYNLYIREAQNSAVSFLTVLFTSSGSVRYRDLNSNTTTVGSYTLGEALPLVLAYDLDQMTYDFSLGGAALLTDESLGSFPQGIGAVLIGAAFDADTDGLVSVDDMLVTATELPSPVESATWSEVKAAWRDE